MDLPEPRPGQTSYSIALVCLGNICRSPTAAVVLQSKLGAAGLADRVTVESSGTGVWHVGEPMDRRASAILTARGLDPSRHRAVQFQATRAARHDLVLVMDASNLRDVRAMVTGTEAADRVLMFRAFDPLAGRADGVDDLDVPDPWFGDEGGFDLVMSIVERTSDELVRRLAALLDEN
jgi:protein-tyrosine phosphatase